MQENKSFFRTVIIIYLTNLLLGIPGGIGLAILSRYLEYSFNFLSKSLAWGFAFLIMSLHVLMKGISSPICGYYSDIKSRRFTMLIGGVLSLFGGACLVFSTYNQLILAIIGTLILGAGRGFFMTSFNVMAGDIGEKYGKVSQTESYCDGLYVFGVIIGGATSLLLQEENPILEFFNIQNFSPFLMLSFLFFIISFIFIFLVVKDTMPKETSKIRDFNYKEIINHENFLPTFMFAFTVEGAESGYIATTLPILLASLQISPDQGALFSTLPFSMGLALFFLFTGIINDKKGRKFTALIGCFFILIFSILSSFLMISTVLIFLIIFLLSGSSTFVRSTIESTWTDVSNPSERGRTYGIFRFFNELGGVIHPFLMFLLNILFDIPIFFSAILIAIFAIISLIIGKKYFKETLH